MEHILEQVKEFTDHAHGGQQRKYTADRYIVHPVRVMQTCRDYVPELSVLAAALLHDVLEDTGTTKEEVYEFLLTIMKKEDAEKTISMVVELTDQFTKAAYPEMNRRQRKAMERKRMQQVSYGAQTIKYADIMDNLKEISSQDREFAPVYLRESKMLLEQMQAGHAGLRQQAFSLLDKEQALLNS